MPVDGSVRRTKLADDGPAGTQTKPPWRSAIQQPDLQRGLRRGAQQRPPRNGLLADHRCVGATGVGLAVDHDLERLAVLVGQADLERAGAVVEWPIPVELDPEPPERRVLNLAQRPHRKRVHLTGPGRIEVQRTSGRARAVRIGRLVGEARGIVDVSDGGRIRVVVAGGREVRDPAIPDHIVDRRADDAGLERGLLEILDVIDDDLRATAGHAPGGGLVLRQRQRFDALREVGLPAERGVERNVRTGGHVVDDLRHAAAFVPTVAAVAQFLQDPDAAVAGQLAPGDVVFHCVLVAVLRNVACILVALAIAVERIGKHADGDAFPGQFLTEVLDRLPQRAAQLGVIALSLDHAGMRGPRHLADPPDLRNGRGLVDVRDGQATADVVPVHRGVLQAQALQLGGRLPGVRLHGDVDVDATAGAGCRRALDAGSGPRVQCAGVLPQADQRPIELGGVAFSLCFGRQARWYAVDIGERRAVRFRW